MAEAIPLFKVFMPESVMEPLRKTLLSGYIGQGPRVDEFEAQLAQWIGHPRVLTLNSCTSALQLALHLANVSHDDEVVTTAMTCMATNVPICAMGAKPVWADIDPHTGNIDAESIRRRITPRTKAILVVHWGGYPCDLREIQAVAKEKGLPVIEDAAHAFGAVYQGKKIGSHSDFVCFSFQAIKHMTTIDGGALLCQREADHKRGKLLRWYGINREGSRKDFRCEEDVLEYGYKFHMNDVCATVGIEQMKYVNGILEKHRDNAAFYNQTFDGLPHIERLRYRTDRLSSYWLYSILVQAKPRFMKHLSQAGVTVSQVHARNDLHTLFKAFRTPLPGVEEYVKKMVCIPVGWWVTKEQRQHVVNTIRSFKP